MARDDALFEGSRLYRQASEGADALEAHFDEDGALHAGIRLAQKADTFEFSDVNELDAAVDAMTRRLREVASNLSPYHVLPMLLESTGRAYFGAKASFFSHLGPALKVATAFLYPEVFKFVAVRSSAHEKVFEFVSGCAVLEQLLALQQMWDLAEDGRAYVTPDGSITTGHLHEVADEFAIAYAQRGRTQRLAADVASALQDLAKLVDGIQKVVEGGDPTTSAGLMGTVFSRISDRNPAFWCGLFARLLMAATAKDTRQHVADGLGLVLLGRAGLMVPTGSGEQM